MSRPGTRAFTKRALDNTMAGEPAGVNYRKLAGKATRKIRGPKVNKKSVKSSKVPREVIKAIEQVKMKFGKKTIKRGKKGPKNKGKYVQARTGAAANLFRREWAAANNARQMIANNAAFNAAIAAEDEAIQAEEAQAAAVAEAQAAAVAEAQAQALEAQAAAIRHGVHRLDRNYAPASVLVQPNSPADSYHGNSMGDLVGRFGRLG